MRNLGLSDVYVAAADTGGLAKAPSVDVLGEADECAVMLAPQESARCARPRLADNNVPESREIPAIWIWRFIDNYR